MLGRFWLRIALTVACLPAVSAYAGSDRAAELGAIARDYNLTTVGAARIVEGEVAWTAYAGEVRPGIPASDSTFFNVGSIAKTIVAETVLRLVNQGAVELDSPLHEHWVDPDLADDPRHKELTPAMVLTHTTGLPNWRFFAADRKLRFVHDPGTAFSYSGEGFEMLGRYLEERLDKPFADIVNEQVIHEIGMDASIDVDKDLFDRIARPGMEDGSIAEPFCRPNGWCRKHGSWSAADDLVVTVPAYARFLLAVASNDGYSEALTEQRNRIQTQPGEYDLIDCNATARCPEKQGYGLGWAIIDYGNSRIVMHGGTDWSEYAVGYISLPDRNGGIVFINALTDAAIRAMPELLKVVDPDSAVVDHYRLRLEKHLSSQ